MSDEDINLEEIDGNKPKVLLADGEIKEVKSKSSSSTYNIKRTDDHYYCTCPAWRTQKGVPTNARTCKHLKELLGDKYELARTKFMDPDGSQHAASTSAAARRSAPKRKKKVEDNEEDEDEEDEQPTRKRAKKDEVKPPDLLLAQKWDLEKDSADPSGWWMSEKLDGVRVYYDGELNTFVSRLGNKFTAPDWFLEKLPKQEDGKKITLDGELFGGRQNFQDTVSIVKTANSKKWEKIQFHIFDIPSMGDEPFETRQKHLENHFNKEDGGPADAQVVVVEQTEVKDKDHLLAKLKEIESLGGEGLMLRKPESLYQPGRNTTLQKVKTFFDAEAEVTGYVAGKGKNKGVTGSLKCKMECGKVFAVGSGLNDSNRKKPPKVGSIIVYRFQELTRDGVPRFPTFIGEAADKKEAKDAEVPEHRKGSGTKKSGDDV